MRTSNRLRLTVAASICCALLLATSLAPMAYADDAEPKHTIKEVMKAHKAGLLKKVVGGDASDEEKKQLLDLYISLVESKPSKGDIGSWHNLAGRAATAAAKVVVGREGAEKELEAATNCKACHDVHK